MLQLGSLKRPVVRLQRRQIAVNFHATAFAYTFEEMLDSVGRKFTSEVTEITSISGLPFL